MKQASLHQIVYRHLFPHPRSSDPQSFSEHLTRNLVPEVRTETAAFYGVLNCAEARYPGLDYSFGPHRVRLGRFVWHRRLFRAFDELGLTAQEIANLCRWEGTKWARERYEAEEGIKVVDSAGLEIPIWVPPPKGPVQHFVDPSTISQHLPRPPLGERIDEDVFERAVEDDESDVEEQESVGVALNERLIAAAAARDQGVSATMDEAWEQWLKEASDRGDIHGVTTRFSNGDLLPNFAQIASTVSSRMRASGTMNQPCPHTGRAL